MIESTNAKEGLYTEKPYSTMTAFSISKSMSPQRTDPVPIKEVKVGDGGHYEEQAEEGHEHGQAEGFWMDSVQLGKSPVERSDGPHRSTGTGRRWRLNR